MSVQQPRGLTIAIQTGDRAESLDFYTKVLGREPDYSPHDDFHEWEVSPRAWLQISTDHDRPLPLRSRLRFDVPDLDAAIAHLTDLGVVISEPLTLPGVVSFANFEDPWGNSLGIYQELVPASQARRPGGSAKDAANFTRQR